MDGRSWRRVALGVAVASIVLIRGGAALRADEDFTPGQVVRTGGTFRVAGEQGAARIADFSKRPQDETDGLLKKSAPPARFAKYAPHFTVEKRNFTFNHVDGPHVETWRVILDQQKSAEGKADVRVVAVITPGGGAHLLAFDPAAAPTEAQFRKMMPTGRWHIDTMLGTPLGTDAFIPGDLKKQDSTYSFHFTKDNSELLLVRHFKGEREITQRVAKPKPGEPKDQKVVQKINVTNSFLLRVDPVTGYTLEGCFDTAVSPKPEAKQYTSATTHKPYDVWPGQAGAHRTVLAPVNVEKGKYSGYFLNMAAIDRCDNAKDGSFRMRDGGFGAYVNDDTLWSATTTMVGGDTKHIAVCNAHADLDLEVLWPAVMEPDSEGLYRHAVWHRVLGLPPEATRQMLADTDMRFADARDIFIRMGTLEDFEDQPRPVNDKSTRGMYWTSTPPQLSETEAHSGKKSLVIKGRAWPNLPQLILEPNSRYRLEAWYKVVNMTGEERAAHKEAWEKRKAEEAKKNKTVADYVSPPNPAVAYVVADFYEWSPHTEKMKVLLKSPVVTAAKPDWQKITWEFETPAWDPFSNLTFVAEGGMAYLDDFQLQRIGDATQPAQPTSTKANNPAETRNPWGEK